jgi:hypothetical protein
MSITIFGISEGGFQRSQKRSLYWLGHLEANYQRVLEKILKNSHIPPEETLKFAPYLAYFFPVFSGSFVSQLKWLVIYLPSDSRRELHFVHSRSQVVADGISVLGSDF